MEEKKHHFSQTQTLNTYIEQILLLVLGIFFLSFPLLFTTLTTDPFTLPKQLLLGGVVLIGILLWGLGGVTDGAIFFRRTPFDIPLLVITAVFAASSLLSLNRVDSLINFWPFLLTVLLYFVVVNTARTKSSLSFFITSFLVGAILLAVLGMLSYFKIYILPFEGTKNQLFTPFGSLFDQTLYLVIASAISIQVVWNLLLARTHKRDVSPIQSIVYILFSLVIVAGTIMSGYALFKLQKPILLPFTVGFQTGFAVISQDTQRLAQSFLFGSGFGTYNIDFSRFRPVTFNLNPELWSFTFFRSSSFVLETLATAGLLGLLAFLFMVVKIVREIQFSMNPQSTENARFGNPFLLALVLITLASFILPFSFASLAIFILVLSFFASSQGIYFPHETKSRYYDRELYIVPFQQGIIAFSNVSSLSEGVPHSKTRHDKSRSLPVTLMIALVVLVVALAYFPVFYLVSDILFQKSIVAASQNQGQQTYDYQNRAIQLFPWRDGYYRIFSQTNLALANFLASQQGAAQNQQVQQTIYTLIQQSINAGRSATTLSPLSSSNWQNLSSIYRSLIGFGQNAENFAVLASQQAITLDPNNPQQYINLGGIYYQLGQWDEAQRQFQMAINLKKDYANAYYNLGHTLEQKGDLKGALTQYQVVQSLVTNDTQNSQKIGEEIVALNQKINPVPQPTPTPSQTTSKSNQGKLGISTPENQLPQKNPQVKIPPLTNTTPTPSASPTP